MRKAMTGEVSYSLLEAIQFARTYTATVERLRARYGGGCDSRNDLLDSMTLCGRLCLTFRKGDLRSQVDLVFQDDGPMARLIAFGENYIAMRICDAAKKYWLVDATRRERELIEEVAL